MGFFKAFRSFNSSRFRLMQENAAFAATVPKGSLVLDAGAGEGTYKPLFDHATYESADFQKVEKSYGSTTYVCDLRHVPVADDRFDYIVFNQVLEHLPEPKLVLIELHRILKPGGRMIFTGPLFYEEHEVPYDFFRYTQFGLKHLFDAAGFEIVRMDWMEGYFGTVGYQLQRMSRYLPCSPRNLGAGLWGLILCPVMLLFKRCCAGFAMVFHQLEKRTKYTARGYPKNYVAILSKQPRVTKALDAPASGDVQISHA